MRHALAAIILLFMHPAPPVVVKQAAYGTVLATVPASQLAYTDSTVVDGGFYVYWLTAVGPACPAQPVCGEGAASNVTGVQAIPQTGQHVVNLTWGAPGTGAVSDNIYRAQVPLAPTAAAGQVQ